MDSLCTYNNSIKGVLDCLHNYNKTNYLPDIDGFQNLISNFNNIEYSIHEIIYTIKRIGNKESQIKADTLNIFLYEYSNFKLLNDTDYFITNSINNCFNKYNMDLIKNMSTTTFRLNNMYINSYLYMKHLNHCICLLALIRETVLLISNVKYMKIK